VSREVTKIRACFGNRRSRGLTLTELLIVVAVMVVLIGVALPMMKTGMEGKSIREASRHLNTYATLAKSRAAELGRPVGLLIETQALPESPGYLYASQLFLAETPPLYSGDVVGAKATIFDAWNNAVAPAPPTGPPPQPVPVLTAGDGVADRAEFELSDCSFLPGLVSKGDLIRFGYRGHLFTITEDPRIEPSRANPARAIIRVLFAHAMVYPWGRPYRAPIPANPGRALTSEEIPKHISPPCPFTPPYMSLPFQILRKPRKSSRTPLELPGGAVIDLTNSGFGLTDRSFSTTSGPVTIVFNPGGDVAGVLGVNLSAPPTATIHLLVGRIDQLAVGATGIPPTWTETVNENLTDMSNLWVSIGHQTGQVTSSENAWMLQPDPPATPTFAASMAAAREFAQNAQTIGGR